MDPNQFMFDSLMLDVLERQPQAPLQPAAPAPARRESSAAKRRHPGRLPMPEHLERVEIVLDIPEEDKLCPETGKPLKLIGWEISEKLEFRPGKVVVNVYKRPKYGSPDSIAAGDVGVIVAPMPEHPIDKCKADVGLLAHIIVSKFADHLPLYRQDGIFEREGGGDPPGDADKLDHPDLRGDPGARR
jgi:transposase